MCQLLCTRVHAAGAAHGGGAAGELMTRRNWRKQKAPRATAAIVVMLEIGETSLEIYWTYL